MDGPQDEARGGARRPGRLRAAGGLAALVAAGALAGCAAAARPAGRGYSPAPRAAAYTVFVANQASDVVSLVGFTPGVGASVQREIPVGVRPNEIEVPHGLAVAPDGRHWYVSIAHGFPHGKVWKMDARADTLLGEADVGDYPEALSISRDGRFIYATNANLQGPPVPSTVSIVYTPTMTELARVPTCVLPRGNALSASGARDYTVCEQSDELVELDAHGNKVRVRMSLTPDKESRVPATQRESSASSASSAPGPEGPEGPVCGPTWVATGRGGAANRMVYVTCTSEGVVLEVNVRSWRVTRRLATGDSPYDAAVTPDGERLVVTLHGAQSVAIYDLTTGRLEARVPTSEPAPHGVVISPDGRYAFVSNEAAGAAPGTLDVIDLARHERVATTSVRFQPGAVAFWRMSGS